MKCLKQLIFSQRIRAKESNHKIEMTLKRFFCPFLTNSSVCQGQLKAFKPWEKLLINAKVNKLLASVKPGGDFDFLKIINRDQKFAYDVGLSDKTNLVVNPKARLSCMQIFKKKEKIPSNDKNSVK